MSRTSELLKQPYAMGRDSFIPASAYAAGLQTRQITRQTTGRTPSAATAPAAPVPTKHRTPAEINFDIDQLQKKRNAIMSEAQKPLQQLGLGTEFSAIPAQSKKLAVEQYGKAGEATRQIKALEEELKQSKAAERRWFMEEEGYRDASPLDLTLRSGKQGYFNSLYGQESYKDMLGLESDKQKYEDLLAGEEYKFLPNGAFQEAVSGGAAQVGQWIRQWSDPRSLAYASSAAGMTALAGQAGPQALAPEEVLTVPGAFFTGLSVGSAQTNLEIEAGFAYNEMIDNGISPETARTIAAVVGVGNAALEFVQADELLKSFKVLKKFDATKGLAGQLFNELLDRGLDVGGEAFQELGQEGVTIAGVQIANLLEKGAWAYDAPTVAGRLGDTVWDSTLSFGASNVPSAMLHTGQIVGGYNAHQRQLGGPLAIPDGLDEATYSRLNQTAEEMYAAEQAQKTAPTEGTGKIDPGARKTIREQVTEMPSADYQIPYISMPEEIVVGIDGQQVPESKMPSAIRKYMAKLFRGKVLSIGKNHKVYIGKDGVEEYAFPARRISGEIKTANMTAGANLDVTLKPAQFLKSGVDDGHHPEATGGWEYFYVMFETDTGIYSGIVNTKVTDRGRVFHDITEIQKESGPPTRGVNKETLLPAKTDPLSSDPIIPTPGDGVKHPSGYVSSISTEALTADRIEYAPGGGEDILTEAALDMGTSGKQGQRKRDAETIRRASSTFGPVGAQMLQEFYRGSDQAPEKYFGGFAVYYHAGMTGQDIMTVRGEYADTLNSAQAKAAYRAGQLDAANSGDAQTPPASR